LNANVKVIRRFLAVNSSVSAVRVAQTYLELAVLVRALEGLRAAADMGSEPDRSALWAGLFDLRENLLNGALEDLRALAA
jgi:hypothetical protein